MIIWLLALVLFASLALTGYTLGAIRASFALVGLLFAALLAMPIGHLCGPVVGALGVKNPFFIWVLGPFVAFLVILIAFKIAGNIVHKKVDVHYKYNAGDLKLGLWNRLNPRLGMCVGILNAAVYLILISWVIYVFSYATFQMVAGDTAPWQVKMFNTAGKNLQDTGMSKVAAAIDPFPAAYYKVADLLGLIYHNDLLESRLSRYPAYLAIGERPQFQDIANDMDFTQLRQKQPPIMDIVNNSKAQAIIDNPDTLKEIWGLTKPNLDDLTAFLKTGQSAKYDPELLLGRWDLDLVGSLNLLKRSKTTMSPIELKTITRNMSAIFAKTVLIATPEKQVYLKDYGKLRPAAKPTLPSTVDMQKFSGQWTSSGGNKYQLNFVDKSSNGTLDAVVDGDKLILNGDAYPMVFDRE